MQAFAVRAMLGASHNLTLELMPRPNAAYPVLAIAALLCALSLLTACSARVTLPPAPEQPRAVVLLDHGGHTSLILTDADAVPWRFAYGDWRWYVEGERGAVAASRALLWQSRAAFGRRALLPPDEDDGWQPQVGSLILGQTAFEAEAARVDALLAQLHAVFEAAEAAPVLVQHLQLEVVPHPQAYSLGHNSNHQVADWLRAVGAEVRGSPVIGRWRVVR